MPCSVIHARAAPGALRLLLAVAAMLAGCDTTGPIASSMAPGDPRPQEIEQAVHRLVFDRGRGRVTGSAVWIGEQRYVTARHVLPEFLFWTSMVVGGTPIDASAFRAMAAMDGQPVMVSLLAAGGSADRIEDDWAVIEITGKTPDHTAAAPPIDMSRVVPPGQPIVLLGFWGDDPEVTEVEGAHRAVSMVPGKVVRPAFPWLTVPESIVCVETAHPDTHHGLSGGAAVVWDDALDRWIIIGVYRGMRVWSGPLGIEIAVHTVARIPAGNLRPADGRG